MTFRAKSQFVEAVAATWHAFVAMISEQSGQTDSSHVFVKNREMKQRRVHHWWTKYLPTQESLVTYRFLSPFRHVLDHEGLWQFNQRSVAGGVAIGLFFSVASPVAQILLAVLMFR